MFDFFKGLLLADLSPEQKTAVWRIAITVIVAGHLVMANGWLPGVDGYAPASEHYKLAGAVQQVESSLLEKDIIESQERFCRAQTDGNVEAQRYSEERRRKLLRRWRELTGVEFDLPTCEELGIE